jgi:hypothetical protein
MAGMVVQPTVATLLGGMDGAQQGQVEMLHQGDRRISHQPVVGMDEIKAFLLQHELTAILAHDLVHVAHPMEKVVSGGDGEPMDVDTIHEFPLDSNALGNGEQMDL